MEALDDVLWTGVELLDTESVDLTIIENKNLKHETLTVNRNSNADTLHDGNLDSRLLLGTLLRDWCICSDSFCREGQFNKPLEGSKDQNPS